MLDNIPIRKFHFRPSNYTLGVGNNHVDVHVVDVTHTEPWIINTYVLHIYRESLAEKLTQTDAHSLKPCRLIQVCRMLWYILANMSKMYRVLELGTIGT